MPRRLDPSKDDKTQSEKLPGSDELDRRGIDPLKEPGDLVAVLDFSPDQHNVRSTHIETHNRSLGARLLTDNKENRLPSQFPECSVLVVGKQLFHQRHAREADAARNPGPLSTL